MSDGPSIGSGWQVSCLEGEAGVAEAAARHVLQAAQDAITARDCFTFAVSGGRTPWQMFADLADLDMPWGQTRIFQVDERIAPAGDPARNLLHLQEALAGLPVDIHPMPVDGADPQVGAHQYAESLPQRFDLIHLGLGPDGHTASLVPGDQILDVTAATVAVTSSYYQGHRRMSLTYPVLNAARRILWLVTGSDKSAALSGLLAHDQGIPAGRVACEDNLVICDDAARSGFVDPA